MAAKQPHYLDSVLAAYFAFALFILLVLFVSPFFLAGVALVVGYRVYRGYMDSPARLGRLAHEQSLELYRQARRLAAERRYPDAKSFTDALYDDLMDKPDFRRPVNSILVPAACVVRSSLRSRRLCAGRHTGTAEHIGPHRECPLPRPVDAARWQAE